MKPFERWTVLPHRPIEKLADNLWRVEGDIEMPTGKVTRVMTLAKLADGRIVIHNAIALEEDAMKEVERWGTPAAIVVPNAFHRLDARIFKDRYPNAKVYCPRGATKKVSEIVKVDGSYDDAPQDATVKLAHCEGTKEREGILEVFSNDGATVVFNDCLGNLPKLGFPMGFFLAPTGKPSVPRVVRWMMVKDKIALGSHMKKLADTPNLQRIIVSHGAPITHGAADTLRTVAAQL